MIGPLLFLGIDFTAIFTDILTKFGNAIPGIIGALIVLFVGLIVSSIVAKIIKKLLARFVDKFAESLNKVDVVSSMNVEVKPSVLLSKLAYYLLVIITLMVAAEVSGMQELSDLMSSIIDYIPKLLSGAIVFIFGLVIADFIKKLIKNACESVGISSGRVISDFIFYFLLVVVAMSALKQALINTDFITTNLTIIMTGIVGAFAVGYGFASRKVMASILSSFFYTKGKINLGDEIKIGDTQGRVVAMDSTSVTVEKDDHNRVIIPLSRCAEENVEIFHKG